MLCLSMEDQVERLVSKTWARFQSTPPVRRLLIGIAGIPGSSKTTLSQTVSRRLNDCAVSASPFASPPATCVPMDGFHLTRAALSAMPDPDHAHARRGAAFTFDVDKFLHLVRALRAPVSPAGAATTTRHDRNAGEQPLAPVIFAPSFDHAIKDPKDDDVAIHPHHRTVLPEGNYLALDAPLWRDAAALLDELWFVDVDFDVAHARLCQRHIRAGIARDLADADRRATENDLVNGAEIVAHRLKVHEIIESRVDPAWSQD